MKTKHLLISFLLGLGLALALLWVLVGTRLPTAQATTLALSAGRTSVAQGVQRPGQRPLLQENDVITVCPEVAGTCPYTNVQAAVDAASDGDVIKVAAGIYTGVQSRPSPPGYPGSSMIAQVVYVSKTVTIRGGYTTAFTDPPDPEANPTTLDAQAQGRVLYITGDISPTIENLRITGGDATSLGGYDALYDGGGGMYVYTATATISNCVIFSNTAHTGFDWGYGGGLYLNSSAAMLSGNTIVSNAAYGGDGGGLFLEQSGATLSGNTIVSNTASGNGGGLYLYHSDATLSGNSIGINSAVRGGGLYLNSSAATLSGNAISGNAADDGGGLYVYYPGAVRLSGNTIVSNTASDDGGGLYLDYWSDATLTNNVVAGNEANGQGSGLYLVSASAQLLHTSIAHNTGGDGSGVYVTHCSFCFPLVHTTIALTNTILVSHTVGISVTEGNTATVNGVLWYGTPITVSQSVTATVTVQNQHEGAPAFAPDGYHLTANSAAIDQGVNAGVATDVDGETRPTGAGYDLGADEFLVALSVTKEAYPDPVQAGALLAYTIRVTNTGNVSLQATVTDTLPTQVTPSGVLTWTPTITPTGVGAPGGV